MKEKIYIGTKKTRTMVIKGYLWVLIYALIPMIIMITGIAKAFEDLSMGLWQILGGVTVLLIIFIFFTPMVGMSQYLEISETEICYYYSRRLSEQFKTVKAILAHQEVDPAMVIKTKDIVNLSLGYQSTQMKGIQGYALILNFLMNDGVMISMKMDDLISQEGIYIKALDLLNKAGVEIVDKYHLRPGLVKDSIYFQEYVKKIIKEKPDDANPYALL